MKRGFVLIVAVLIIFMSLASVAADPLAAGNKSKIKEPTGQGKNSTLEMPFPVTCSMIWEGNCSEPPPESFDNTFDSCDNGFGGDESINEVYINQSYLLFGSTLEATCNVMMWGVMGMNSAGCEWGWQGDRLNILYRNSSSEPWRKMSSINQVYSCFNYSIIFFPDNVTGVHQLRCAIGYKINPNAECANGDFYDNDDINFTVLSEFPPQEYISITLSGGTPIDFGDDATPGTTDIPAINNPLTITIDSNVNFDITTRANSSVFTSSTEPTDSFPSSNMKWQTSPSSPLMPYLTEEQIVYSNELAGTFNMYHLLSIPLAQPPGLYSTGVIITAKKGV
jgi:hypothetical protein